MLSELAVASAALSNEEQQRREAEVQLAIAVEEHAAGAAEQHAAAVEERSVAQQSLHAMALSLAAVEEQLEESRRPQLLPEVRVRVRVRVRVWHQTQRSH